jgi:hypothetical protein
MSGGPGFSSNGPRMGGGPGPSIRGNAGPRVGGGTQFSQRGGNWNGNWHGRRHGHFRPGFAFGFGGWPYYDDYYDSYAYAEPDCGYVRERYILPNGRVAWRTVERCY